MHGLSRITSDFETNIHIISTQSKCIDISGIALILLQINYNVVGFFFIIIKK